MKQLVIVVLIVVIGGNILKNAEEYNRSNPFVYAAEPEAPAEPKVVLIEPKIEWTPERIEKEIRNTFPEEPDLAVAIAKAESHGLKADAYNPEAHKDKHGNVICNGSYGIMQIACVHHNGDKNELYDVQFNLKKARELYEKEGWKPWGAYTNGSYKKHL